MHYLTLHVLSRSGRELLFLEYVSLSRLIRNYLQIVTEHFRQQDVDEMDTIILFTLVVKQKGAAPQAQ